MEAGAIIAIVAGVLVVALVIGLVIYISRQKQRTWEVEDKRRRIDEDMMRVQQKRIQLEEAQLDERLRQQEAQRAKQQQRDGTAGSSRMEVKSGVAPLITKSSPPSVSKHGRLKPKVHVYADPNNGAYSSRRGNGDYIPLRPKKK